jgi:hypothetical protein
MYFRVRKRNYRVLESTALLARLGAQDDADVFKFFAPKGSQMSGRELREGRTTAHVNKAANPSPTSSIACPSPLRFVLFAAMTCAFLLTSAQAKAQTPQYDGPAELPLATVNTAMTDTPAQGSIISVSAGGNLQTALDNAQCGDIIELQAGATFTGKFKVPNKNCNNLNWILIRTSAPDSALPAEGVRATPCYAGVASLQGRPQYNCANPQDVMARVQNNQAGDGPFQLESGANYYRFLGLEITRPAGTPGAGRLISARATADHIVVDRSWLHGAPQDETAVGVSLNGMTNAAVVDSYFSDFHCISVTGTCTDAHPIGGGVSNTQDGPFKIQDNFLEGSGQSILFGGGAATKTPSDITIVGNHFFKPWQWMPGNPNFIGGANGRPFIVKNHLEIKNAVRVLVDSNLMENNWGGFSQTGFSILLTPKNQHQGNGNVCPTCEVTDITIRYSHMSHLGAGIQLATSLSGNGADGAPAQAGTRWSLHDLVFDDLSTNYDGGGSGLLIANSWPENPVNTITINHITLLTDPESHVMIAGNKKANPQMFALVITNSLLVTGTHPVWNADWGRASCGYSDLPVTTLTSCFSNSTFANNALIMPPPQYPASTWPANNMFAATIADVGFTDFNNGDGGNYELLSSSPYKNAGTDGKDLGADIVGLNAALAGVE